MGFDKKDVLNLAILSIIIVFVLWNTFSNAFIGGTNDLEPHAYSLWYLKDSMINYHYIPQWTSDFFGGKPFLGLYPPLVYFLLLPISLIFNPVITPKIAILVISLLSTFFFYLLAKYLFKDNTSVLLATAIFTVFPNRMALTNGGTLADLTAIMFVPLIFLYYEKIKEKASLKNLSVFSLLSGLTLLTHHAVGGTAIAVVILFGLYDYIIEKKDIVIKIIPFLILSILMALVFLIPAYQIQNTLNFAVTESTGQAFRPFDLQNFFIRADSHGGGEFIGVLATISFLVSLLFIKKEKNLAKYSLVSLLLLLLGLYLYFLIPNLIQGTLQGAHRFFSIMAVTLTISVVIGLKNGLDDLVPYLKKSKIVYIKKDNDERIKQICFILLSILIVLSYIQFRPQAGNELSIPNGVLKFYENISNDTEYYRIEDQAFAPFGFSPILHHHGILNGAPSQEAPKYHFFLWSNAWQLLKTPQGAQNLAGLYGSLAIKYILSGSHMNVNYFQELKCGNNYCIYQNEKFLPYTRIVPTVIGINQPEPDYLITFLNALANYTIPFDRLAFSHSNIGTQNANLVKLQSSAASVTILNKEPGYLKLEVSNLTDQEYLVVAESYHPYWKAYQDGSELSIYEGIPSTLIIPINSNGVIELKYTTPIIKELLFYLTILIIVVLAILIIYDNKIRL